MKGEKAYQQHWHKVTCYHHQLDFRVCSVWVFFCPFQHLHISMPGLPSCKCVWSPGALSVFLQPGTLLWRECGPAVAAQQGLPWVQVERAPRLMCGGSFYVDKGPHPLSLSLSVSLSLSSSLCCLTHTGMRPTWGDLLGPMVPAHIGGRVASLRAPGVALMAGDWREQGPTGELFDFLAQVGVCKDCLWSVFEVNISLELWQRLVQGSAISSSISNILW